MSRLLQDVVGELSKLPGIGRRTALRLAIHILRMERESVAEMTESIDRFRNEVKYCTQCNNLSDEDVCPICADDDTCVPPHNSIENGPPMSTTRTSSP